MEQLNFPNPFIYESISDFFKEFFELNQENSDFSHRKLAKRLNWPVSLCSDVISNRKNLSVQRVLEFSLFAKYNSFEIEKIIWLSIKDSVSQNVSDELQEKKVLGNFKRDNDTRFRDTFNNIKKGIVLETLKWLQKETEPELISNLIKTCQISEDEVRVIIDELTADGLIEIRDGKYFFLKDILSLDDKYSSGEMAAEYERHSSFVKCFLNFLKEPQGPASINTAITHIPLDRFEEVHKKALHFRNWITEIGVSNSELNKIDKEHFRPFQLELHLFPILDKKLTKDLSN